MERPRWTDERLDDLKDRVDRGFAETKAEIRDVRGEIAGVRGEIAGVRGEIAGVHNEIGALSRNIHQFTLALVGTVFLGFCGTIAALVTLA